MTNRLYYGDNLDVLREQVKDESVDLVYLDPPFNSNANYNILFKSPTGTSSDAQIEAFEDTWHWNDHAEEAFDQVMQSGNTQAFELLRAMRGFLGDNDMMAYLTMMAIRLIELHRVLKPTGSLYLHCDPTASHYLKLLLDGVFGADKFQNEIIWKRTGSHGGSRRWGPIHDTILFYSKATEPFWNRIYQDYEESYLRDFYRFSDERGSYRLVTLTGAGTRNGDSGAAWRGVDPTVSGRHWAVPTSSLARAYPDQSMVGLTTQQKLDLLDQANLIYWPPRGSIPQQKRYVDEGEGVPVQDVVTDIGPISSQAQERLGYPTQKPLALLERIIAASSNPGDVVLDPFCGCGTAVHAAQKLGRQWLGIDITHLAITLIEKRMKAAFPGIAFTVEGTPKDLASAVDLATRDKYQFQWWAVSMVDAMPFGGKKKGADGGIDGLIYFKPDGKKTEKAIVSVKGGDNVGVQMIRDLHSAMEREKAPIGVFITKALPTSVMEREAAAVGRFQSTATGKSYARLQIITLAELFQGKKPDIPYVDPTAGMKRAAREDTATQATLL
ncbi:DNA methyltransferase [Sphingomonas echinoides]|uniref:site-specific DNA-methyltransferase (adenine-specific) n=1 Tax=Sphingomonas echinoides TaxID=59803 RepID=A0ABU4PRQ1_9SPHN|nr:DNA methyltransferase [Sphingomonas echinoides]MDX5985867.1 DNA methyltransferase [Sphingomonas echinoides]